MIGDFDRYTIRARLLPVLVIFLPGALTIFGSFPVEKLEWGTLAALLTSFGFTALLSQLGRDQGKKKEPFLYERWGGAPAIAMLRYGGSKFNHLTLKRYHKKLSDHLKVSTPSPELEKDEPNQAEIIYQGFVDFLKEKTRDKKSFPLVFAENVNYGFRRNLWALKPAGLAIGAVSWLVMVLYIFLQFRATASVLLSSIFSLFVNSSLLAVWLFWITPRWVRAAALAYAQRLIASTDNL